jgi:hypothetical protein
MCTCPCPDSPVCADNDCRSLATLESDPIATDLDLDDNLGLDTMIPTIVTADAHLEVYPTTAILVEDIPFQKTRGRYHAALPSCPPLTRFLTEHTLFRPQQINAHLLVGPAAAVAPQLLVRPVAFWFTGPPQTIRLRNAVTNHIVRDHIVHSASVVVLYGTGLTYEIPRAKRNAPPQDPRIVIIVL